MCAAFDFLLYSFCILSQIEAVGYRLCEVSADDTRWFKHNRVWFDGQDERTERYLFFHHNLS
jgi:hypothetical protein